MLITQELRTIINHLEPSEYPQSVTDACAIEAEAEAVLARVNSGEPVDLTALRTAKDVSKVHSAAVAQTIGREVQVEIARKILDIARGMVGDAWFIALPEIGTVLGARFDAAASVLVSEVTAYGQRHLAINAAREHWNPLSAALRDALATLNALRQARDSLAFLGVVEVDKCYSAPFEQNSRTLWFPSTKAHDVFHRDTISEPRDDYYIIAATTPGVVIEWQTKAQQQAQPTPAHIAKSRAAMAEQIAERDAFASARRRR